MKLNELLRIMDEEEYKVIVTKNAIYTNFDYQNYVENEILEELKNLYEKSINDIYDLDTENYFPYYLSVSLNQDYIVTYIYAKTLNENLTKER